MDRRETDMEFVVVSKSPLWIGYWSKPRESRKVYWLGFEPKRSYMRN